mmetsp:Transcript_107708/g.168212  ORF Transcript_107708/g.168212 Transcript_107708/m.168212 type:complete len:167 (+) Transcript_107708:1-501(+)
MGSVGCYQQGNQISNKLNECQEDSDRIAYLQEEALDKKSILGKFAGNCQSADSALECITAVNQGDASRQVQLVACCTEEEGVPVELNDYHSEDVARVFYLMEEAIHLDITAAREGHQEESPGGFYEVGTLPATDDGEAELRNFSGDVQLTREIAIDEGAHSLQPSR